MKCYYSVVTFYLSPAPGLSGAQNEEDRSLSLHSDVARATDERSAGASLPGADEASTSEALLEAVIASLTDDKAEDIVRIDLSGQSSIGDYMVVCSGRSSRQVTAISEKLTDRLKQQFGRISRVEGQGTGDWVLVDVGDVIVHVFRPEVREFYQLEKMWKPVADSAHS